MNTAITLHCPATVQFREEETLYLHLTTTRTAMKTTPDSSLSIVECALIAAELGDTHTAI
jgi:hypothetical protein